MFNPETGEWKHRKHQVILSRCVFFCLLDSPPPPPLRYVCVPVCFSVCLSAFMFLSVFSFCPSVFFKLRTVISCSICSFRTAIEWAFSKHIGITSFEFLFPSSFWVSLLLFFFQDTKSFRSRCYEISAVQHLSRIPYHCVWLQVFRDRKWLGSISYSDGHMTYPSSSPITDDAPNSYSVRNCSRIRMLYSVLFNLGTTLYNIHLVQLCKYKPTSALSCMLFSDWLR